MCKKCRGHRSTRINKGDKKISILRILFHDENPVAMQKGEKLYTHTHNTMRKTRRQMPQIFKVHPRGHTNPKEDR